MLGRGSQKYVSKIKGLKMELKIAQFSKRWQKVATFCNLTEKNKRLNEKNNKLTEEINRLKQDNERLKNCGEANRYSKEEPGYEVSKI